MVKIPFDFSAWRGRMRWSVEQARVALGVSRSHYYKLEREGIAWPYMAWAAYGLETFEQLNANTIAQQNQAAARATV